MPSQGLSVHHCSPNQWFQCTLKQTIFTEPCFLALLGYKDIPESFANPSASFSWTHNKDNTPDLVRPRKHFWSKWKLQVLNIFKKYAHSVHANVRPTLFFFKGSQVWTKSFKLSQKSIGSLEICPMILHSRLNKPTYVATLLKNCFYAQAIHWDLSNATIFFLSKRFIQQLAKFRINTFYYFIKFIRQVFETWSDRLSVEFLQSYKVLIALSPPRLQIDYKKQGARISSVDTRMLPQLEILKQSLCDQAKKNPFTCASKSPSDQHAIHMYHCWVSVVASTGKSFSLSLRNP